MLELGSSGSVRGVLSNEHPYREPGSTDMVHSSAGHHHFKSRSSFRASSSKARICLRSAIASPVKRPCFRAFWLPRGAPDPSAPPCMRQRLLPRTAGAWHVAPQRVLAPQRGLVSIDVVLRS